MKMNKKMRTLMGTGAAAVLALGLAFPVNASTASAQTVKTIYSYSSTSGQADWLKFWQNFYKVSAAKPAASAVPTAAPVASAKPAATPAPTPAPTTAPAPTSAPAATPAAAQSESGTFVQQVVALVNAERAKAGLGAVAPLESLNKVAAAKATDMRVNNYFSHTSPTYGSPFDMMAAFGVTYQYAGENIAMGQKTPQEVMTAWMNSAGHRANILNANFNYIGAGFDGGYWVQEFIGKK